MILYYNVTKQTRLSCAFFSLFLRVAESRPETPESRSRRRASLHPSGGDGIPSSIDRPRIVVVALPGVLSMPSPRQHKCRVEVTRLKGCVLERRLRGVLLARVIAAAAVAALVILAVGVAVVAGSEPIDFRLAVPTRWGTTQRPASSSQAARRRLQDAYPSTALDDGHDDDDGRSETMSRTSGEGASEERRRSLTIRRGYGVGGLTNPGRKVLDIGRGKPQRVPEDRYAVSAALGVRFERLRSARLQHLRRFGAAEDTSMEEEADPVSFGNMLMSRRTRTREIRSKHARLLDLLEQRRAAWMQGGGVHARRQAVRLDPIAAFERQKRDKRFFAGATPEEYYKFPLQVVLRSTIDRCR